MRKLALLLLMAVLISGFIPGCSQKVEKTKAENASAIKIAEKVKKAYDSAKTVEGWEYLTMVYGGKTYNDSVKFVILKPDRVWMYDKTYNAYLISNGTYTWIYDKTRNVVKVEKTTPEHPPDYARYIDGLLTLFNVSYGGTRNFNGKNCYVLRLTPNGSTNTNVYGYMYVLPDYKVAGIYFRLNTTIYNIKFEDVMYNVSINESMFNFTPPKGAKVYRVIETLKIGRYKSVKEAQKFAQFRILTPKYTAGYRLKEVCVYGGIVLLEYVKGANETLVKETMLPIPYPLDARNVTLNNVTFHVWYHSRTYVVFQLNNVSILISTPLNETQALKIAESMI